MRRIVCRVWRGSLNAEFPNGGRSGNGSLLTDRISTRRHVSPRPINQFCGLARLVKHRWNIRPFRHQHPYQLGQIDEFTSGRELLGQKCLDRNGHRRLKFSIRQSIRRRAIFSFGPAMLRCRYLVGYDDVDRDPGCWRSRRHDLSWVLSSRNGRARAAKTFSESTLARRN